MSCVGVDLHELGLFILLDSRRMSDCLSVTKAGDTKGKKNISVAFMCDQRGDLQELLRLYQTTFLPRLINEEKGVF